MKKSSFVAMMLGTVSGVCFALGMCMALVAEWDLFWPGTMLGCVGVLLGLMTVGVWRKMRGKPLFCLSFPQVRALLAAGVGVLVFGIGMCCTMIWDKMVVGVIVGLLGIFILLCCIPLVKGVKN